MTAAQKTQRIADLDRHILGLEFQLRVCTEQRHSNPIQCMRMKTLTPLVAAKRVQLRELRGW